MQDVGAAYLRSKLDEAGALKGGFSDAAAIRAIMEGVRIHRLASGQATERHEMLVAMWNRIIVEIPAVFDEALACLPDARALTERDIGRTRASFAHGFDAVVERHMASDGPGMLASGESAR